MVSAELLSAAIGAGVGLGVGVGAALIQWRKAKPESESLAIRGLREALDGLMTDLSRKDAELKAALAANAEVLEEAKLLHRQLGRLEAKLADEPPPHLA